MTITEPSAFIARIDALCSIVDAARITRGAARTGHRAWNRIALHVDRMDATRREDARLASELRQAAVASYVAEGLGEWFDFCPSDNG